VSSLASKFVTPLIILMSIVLGFVFPDVGLMWRPYLALLLMFLMFFVTLDIEPKQLGRSLSNFPVIVAGLFMVFVVTPLLSLLAKPFFSPIVYAGIVLAFSCPAAVATAFWAKVFRADVPAALIISTVTNLLSIVTIPTTMIIAIGTTISMDVAGMMLNLAEIVLIPMTASLLIKKYAHINHGLVTAVTSRTELVILVFLVWGSTAPGVAYAKENVTEFVTLNVFLLLTLALAFVIAYFLTRRLGHKQAVSIGIATTVKNVALSLVIGSAAFGSQIIPPLIANLIAQNLLLIPLKAAIKDNDQNTQESP
jgi:BASS family bile acid:Na+ symporter